ncbi:MAG: hypothetical protein M5U26_30740 [Planctomycetota bacterium]|nr:hypothetical protein [Planctomycetota bacterium]
MSIGLALGATAGEGRVGFEEPFDSAEGWAVAYGAPLKQMKAEGGTVRFETVCGALGSAMKMKRADWPEWPEKPFESNTGIKKNYGRKIDLDTYRYVAVKLDERGTMVKLAVCGRWIPVCYTTGLHVFDLKNSPYGETRDLVLTLEFLNTSGACTFDSIRFLSELNEEERAALLPPPVAYPKWNRTAKPYHGLEALNARAGRSRLPEAEGQLAAYRDTLSGGLVWRLTCQPGDQAFSAGDTKLGWTREGRYFRTAGGLDGRKVFDHFAGRWQPTAGGAETKALPDYHGQWPSRKFENVTYGYRVQWRKPEADFVFYRFDAATGEEREWGKLACDGKWDVRELAPAEHGERAVVGLRGTPNVWLLDPEAEPEKRITPIRLKTRLKGVRFAKDDTTLQWHNCYTYESWELDLKTNETRLGYEMSGSHAGGGGGRSLRHYEGLTTVQPAGLTDWKAGDLVKIFAYFKEELPTDYGHLVDGGRWWLVNGTGGDVASQHLLVDGEDCATVLRLCGYYTSRNSWMTNTYTTASPDATKVAWVSDQLGDGDVYFVVARAPDPVRGLKLEAAGGEVKLVWEAPARSKECAGYVIYGAKPNEKFVALNKDPIKETHWSGKAEGRTRFMVAMREWSGLEGLLSPVVKAPGDASPENLYLPAALAERSRTARLRFDGHAAGCRAAHYWQASAAEKEAPTLTWKGVAVPAGKVKAFARCQKDDGTWHWEALAAGFEAAGDGVRFELPKEKVVDALIVTGDPNYEPAPGSVDERFAPPPPVTNAKAARDERGVVTLTWTPPAVANLAYVEVREQAPDRAASTPGPHQHTLGAALASQPQEFRDWDLKPGLTVVYELVPVDTRGNRGDAARVSVKIPEQEKPVLLELKPDPAQAGAAFEAVQRGGLAMLAPKAAAEKAKPDDADWKALELPFEVREAGRYAIWARYAPGATGRLHLRVALDDGKPQTWRLRAPGREMSSTFNPPKLGAEKVFSDRVVLGGAGGQDVFELSAGKHTLKLSFDPTIEKGQVHALEQVWIVNDPSFRPPGYDPRADFGK